ncbi:hypothetical protein [Tateyamaria sp. Alg231-49]|uniref:hypothetical protein n=1 Tax=Tateyamaria sp. Alg231-49 TaxID=1922219 RepID=UPI001F398EA1|nr:hypothetical protein [Tateyamaria sp. Alg231-49]
MKHSFGYRLDDLVDLPDDFRQITFGSGPVLSEGAGEPVELFLIGSGELCDQIGVQQLILETGQNANFQSVPLDGR